MALQFFNKGKLRFLIRIPSRYFNQSTQRLGITRLPFSNFEKNLLSFFIPIKFDENVCSPKSYLQI